jgi:transmembrane sensor
MATPRAAAGEGIDGPPPRVTPQIAAEAAVWVARLHGPDRSAQMERECRAWQALSAEHREAFERCTETWLDVPRITLSDAFSSASAGSAEGARSGGRLPARWAMAFAVVLLAVIGFFVLREERHAGEYTTGVGEQQLVVLGDGTRMALNTATRVSVDMGSSQRTVRVDRGEAFFEVAKDVRRPFVVRLAGAEVVALDTVFSVRYTPDAASGGDDLAVTMIKGEATVRGTSDAGSKGAAPGRTLTMRAGERLRVGGAARAFGAGSPGAAAPQVDRPNIEQIVAWRRNEVVFDDASLADAVAEMNRYNRTPIVLVPGFGSTGLRVSGVYRTGDNVGFARAVAALHGLTVVERDGRVELSKPH